MKRRYRRGGAKGRTSPRTMRRSSVSSRFEAFRGPFRVGSSGQESLNPIADMKTELEGRHGRETNIALEDLEMHEKQMEQKRWEDPGGKEV